MQLKLHDHQVVVSNTTLETIPGAKVSAEIYDLSGKRLARQSAVLVAGANATTPAFTLDEAPTAGHPLYFVRLRLASRDGRALSDNFYWRARHDEDNKALNDLPRAALTGTARLTSVAGVSRVEIQLRNPSTSIVLMVKPTLRTTDGQRVLPASATDGYFSLVPGEGRTVRIEAPNTTGPLQVSLEGWNAERVVLPVQDGR